MATNKCFVDLDALTRKLSPADAELARSRIGRIRLTQMRTIFKEIGRKFTICRKCKATFANDESQKICERGNCRSRDLLHTRAIRIRTKPRLSKKTYEDYGRLGGIERTKSISIKQRTDWSAKGGENRKDNLSPERLKEIARMGGKARHKKST